MHKFTNTKGIEFIKKLKEFKAERHFCSEGF